MQTWRKTLKDRGFTLIELLIVIAIILILIAIALPNFLEAQERARVTRAKAQLRTFETALFAHITDYGYVYADFNDGFLVTSITRNKVRMQRTPCGVNSVPLINTSSLTFSVDQRNFYSPNLHCPLTTPMRYLDAKATTDPWGDGSVPIGMDSREIETLRGQRLSPENGSTIVYAAYFVSGPDRNNGEWARGGPHCTPFPGMCKGTPYSATNGTQSRGDLWFVVSTMDTQFAKNEYEPLKTW